ncbi:MULTISPECIES: BolA family protein [Hyphobacterium]|uniref:BolA family protein n=1 Tax=Hyphobacterium vulgare TaxID=1736751 RepID=A0ABV6ZY67_9PROT
MGEVRDRIAAKLAAAFRPARLDVTDESAAHAGHAGAREGGESHFHVLIVAEAFAGKSRLERQRAVNAALAEELAGPVHALRMTVKSPSEG